MDKIARLNESSQGKEHIIVENKIKLDFYQKREVEYKEINSKIEKYEKELTEKDQIEKELKEKIKSFEIQLSPNNNEKSILNDEEISVLKYIGENPSNATSSVSSKLNIHRIRLEKIYQKLLEKEFIKINTTYSDGGKEYRIEPKGSDFLLENNLV
jgi:septal ring factor EnvC (AmiA/AmiB activator)